MIPVKMKVEQIQNRRRIIEMTYEAGVAQLSSTLSAVDIIEAVYAIKRPGEKFVLSNGHAAIALYAVMERYGLLADPKVAKLKIHPDRNPEIGIEVSTGSLGQGLPIAAGMALANREKNVYCCISDGECAEGSIWESLRIAVETNLTNLKIIVNFNGFSAYRETEARRLIAGIQSFGLNLIETDGHDLGCLSSALGVKTIRPLVIFAYTRVDQLPFLSGLSAHYHVMSESDYKLALTTWSSE